MSSMSTIRSRMPSSSSSLPASWAKTCLLPRGLFTRRQQRWRACRLRDRAVTASMAVDRWEEAAYRAIYVDGLRHVLEALVRQQQSPQRVLLNSSTAVYAQSAGEWVDETSPTKPQHFTGRRVLEGERVLLDGPFPATVLRL